jgi:hypothetical protein
MLETTPNGSRMICANLLEAIPNYLVSCFLVAASQWMSSTIHIRVLFRILIVRALFVRKILELPKKETEDALSP